MPKTAHEKVIQGSKGKGRVILTLGVYEFRILAFLGTDGVGP